MEVSEQVVENGSRVPENHLTETSTHLAAAPHGSDSKDCPTFYDGCHCTVETLRFNIERAETAEDKLKQRALADRINADERFQIFKEIGVPECEIHGGYCSPHVAGWMKSTKDRAEKAESDLKTVLQREAATTERHDKRVGALEDRIRVLERALSLAADRSGSQRWIEKAEQQLVQGIPEPEEV